MCGELQLECVRRYLPVRWLGELASQPPAEVAAVLRLEGAALPDGQREKVLADLQKPRAINLFPGGGPLRGNAMPTLIFSDDGVRLRQHVEVDSPAIDKDESKIPADVTVLVVDSELTKAMLKLAGPGWERQPILENDPAAQPELEKYGLENLFRVTELNLRPSQPRVTISGPGPLTGP
jgi:hypothetical protein